MKAQINKENAMTTGMSELLSEYVSETTKQLVDHPDEVEVKVAVSTKAVIVQIRVDQRDCGKVIGKKGRTIDALKVIALAIKNTRYPEDSRKVNLEILEDEKSSFSYNREMGG